MKHIIVGKNNSFRFTPIRVIETEKSYYILFSSHRQINDFMIKFFMRDIYDKEIPKITLNNDLICIEKDGIFYIKEV